MDKVLLYDWFERLATIFEDKRVFRVKKWLQMPIFTLFYFKKNNFRNKQSMI